MCQLMSCHPSFVVAALETSHKMFQEYIHKRKDRMLNEYQLQVCLVATLATADRHNTPSLPPHAYAEC